MAQEHNKSLNLGGAKKRLEDYEHMLQYYTLMRMKNKMKDSEVESKEWWKVVEEYSTKELEKNLAQHRIDERIIRYKLETYQKTFLDFIYGSPTSTKIPGQDEEIKVRLGGTTHEEEMQIKEPHDLKTGAA
jgi:hypothetical protein